MSLLSACKRTQTCLNWMPPFKSLSEIIGTRQLCFNIHQVTVVAAKVHWCDILLTLLHMNCDFDVFWNVNPSQNVNALPLKAYLSSCMLIFGLLLYSNIWESLLCDSFSFLTEAGLDSLLGPLNCLVFINGMRGADVIGPYWGSHKLQLLMLQFP